MSTANPPELILDELPESMPAASVAEYVAVSRWARWAWFLRLFAPGWRLSTVAERALTAELAVVRLDLAGEKEISMRLRWQVQELEAEVAVRKRQLELMADVIERERLRVQAESASFAKAIAEAAS